MFGTPRPAMIVAAVAIQMAKATSPVPCAPNMRAMITLLAKPKTSEPSPEAVLIKEALRRLAIKTYIRLVTPDGGHCRPQRRAEGLRHLTPGPGWPHAPRFSTSGAR